MKYTDNAINILTVAFYLNNNDKKVREWIVSHLKGNENVDTLVKLLNDNKYQITIEDFERKKKCFKERLTQEFENCCDGCVALGDPKFPQYRGKVKESEQPFFLYYKGNIDLLGIENKNISVIGLLNPKETEDDDNIEKREQKMVSEFVKNGATIVSGLAFGCDSIAHKQALDSNGKTIAILPSPLNNILPKSNQTLAWKIAEEGGLLVTEYGTKFKDKWELIIRYKERDRLQALFCDTIVLVASYAKNSSERIKRLHIPVPAKLDSGACLAMEAAKKYNIPRAVMYDEKLDEKNPMFHLNQDLKEQDKNITIIKQINLTEKVRKIMQSSRVMSANQASLEFK